MIPQSSHSCVSSSAQHAGVPGPDPRQHRPHSDQRDLQPPRLSRDAAEERPRADQLAVRPCKWEEASGQHQAQSALHLQLHQGDQGAGNHQSAGGRSEKPKSASLVVSTCLWRSFCREVTLYLTSFLASFQGVITFLGPEEGIINSDLHGELPFSTCENFSDTEFSSSDIHKEVEFTVATVSPGS